MMPPPRRHIRLNPWHAVVLLVASAILFAVAVALFVALPMLTSGPLLLLHAALILTGASNIMFNYYVCVALPAGRWVRVRLGWVYGKRAEAAGITTMAIVLLVFGI